MEQVETAPLRVSISVATSIERAFRVFTGEMGTWWPMATHSIGEDEVVLVAMEPHEGGRIFERLRDGTESDWGRVTTWDPPRRVAFTWRPTLEERPFTDVEVTFTPADGATVVELVHTGWERLGDEGAELRRSYSTGWGYVLGECYGGALS
jgi:uncharacterized protein YndB with AHSA1/START domain